MLASILSNQSLPAKSQGKDNSISDATNGEEFSEHLDANSKNSPEMEVPNASEMPETAEMAGPEPQLSPQLQARLQPQSPMQEDALGLDGEFPILESIEEVVSEVELGSMPVEPLPELLDSEKIINILRFSHLVNQRETEVAKPAINEETLASTSEAAEEPMVAKNAPIVAQQISAGGEKIAPNAPIQMAATGNGMVRDSKPNKEKADKPSSSSMASTLTANLQTPTAIKPNDGVQKNSPQADMTIQPKIDLPQDKNPTSDADLEKTVRSLDVKVNAAPVSADPSSVKLSADGNVPSLSQPSQTLVRAIQENSNWTKVMNTSSVQLETTPKLDGTVLQKLDIHLNLSTIGKLDVKLRLQQGELQIQIRTDSEQAFKALSTDQDALANTIKGLGYKVDNIAISGPRTDSGFQMNSNAQAQSQHHSAEHQAQSGNGGQRTDRESMPMKDADNDTSLQTSVDETVSSNVDVI